MLNRWSPIGLLGIMLVVVAMVETMVMWLLNHVLPQGPATWRQAAIDVLLLTLGVAPLLWFLAIRPLRERYRETVRVLQESDQFFRRVFDESPLGEVISTPDYRFQRVNGALCRFLGYSPDELKSLDFKAITHPDDLLGDVNGMQRLAAGDLEVYETEKRYVRKDGEIVWGHLSVRALRDRDGRLFCYLPIVEDITARKRTEGQLKTLQKAVEASGEVIFLTGLDGTFSFVNPEFTRVYGHSAADIVGKATPRILKSGLLPPEAYSAFWQNLLNKQVVRGTIPNQTQDGRLVDMDTSANPVLDNDGNITSFLCIQRDVTERNRMENALRESEERYRAVVETAEDAIFALDAEGRFTFLNSYAAREVGGRPQELIGKRLDDLFPPELASRFLGSVTQVIGTGIPMLTETKMPFPAGNRWMHTWLTPLRDKDGTVRAVLGVARDTTERRQQEEALKQSYDGQQTLNKLLQLALEESADELEDVLARALALALNGPWPATLGKGVVFLVDEAANELVLKAHSGVGAEILSQCARVPFGHCLCGRVAASGEPLHACRIDERHDTTFAAMREHGHYCVPITAANTLLGVLNVYVPAGRPYDLREEDFFKAFASTLAGIVLRHRAEQRIEVVQQQLIQSQKMEAIGRLAGGVAHDFNNLLTAILGYSEMLVNDLPDDTPARRDLQEIHDAGQRAAGLTRQLLAFSRKQVLLPTIFPLHEVVAGTGALLRRLIGEDIELVTVIGAESDRVRADRGQIEQVLMNLAVNARDAMPEGGRLTIETGAVDLDDAYSRRHHPVAPGHYVMLAVSDTGTGMSPETQARLFEPFFTTKELGKGTGLGLATVYGIVKQSGGYIWAYSELGLGSTFKVYLPRVDESPVEVGADRPAVAHGVRAETILIVEDEDAVRNLARRVLEKSGYTVLSASSGEDGLRVASGHAGKIDLVLTDMVMPGMNGRQLAKQMREADPELLVLYSSGYTENVFGVEGLSPDREGYLQKPFTPASLEGAVVKLLDRGPGAAEP